MFKILKDKNFLSIKNKDRFDYVQPSFKMLFDLSSLFESQIFSENTQMFNLCEMYLEGDLLIFLAEKGLIFIVDVIEVRKQTGRNRVKVINKFASDVRIAKSIGLNKANDSLLIVYLNREGNGPELKCNSISLDQLRSFVGMETKTNQEQILLEGNLNFVDLFTSENLTSPAFVEFDEINFKIITRNSLGTYKIWRMSDMKVVLELTDKRIEEIRTAEGMLLTIRSTDLIENLLLTIYDIETGKLVINYVVKMFPDKVLEILEVFDKVLLLKQENYSPILLDLISMESSIINNPNLDEKSLFIYLSKMQVFLSLGDNTLTFYSNKGKEMTSITNAKVKELNPNHVHVTADKNFLLVYWEERKSEKKKVVSNFNQNNVVNKTPKPRVLESNRRSILSEELFSDVSLQSSYRRRSINNLNNLNNFNNNINSEANLSKLKNSNVSRISGVSDINQNSPFLSNVQILDNNTEKELFTGEFELICLKEDLTKINLNITSDNSKVIQNDEIVAIENEKISYFTFNTQTMRIYTVTKSGKLFECSI